jgi:hypothetical protein
VLDGVRDVAGRAMGAPLTSTLRCRLGCLALRWFIRQATGLRAFQVRRGIAEACDEGADVNSSWVGLRGVRVRRARVCPLFRLAVAAGVASVAAIFASTPGALAAAPAPGDLEVIAGTAGACGAPTPGPATSSGLTYPEAVAVDSAGNVYIADTGNNVVEKVTPSGTLSIIAGTGTAGAPTPGPATRSDLRDPDGVAVDSAGNVYIADTGNNVVEKVTPSGTLSIIAGKSGIGAEPTPGPATSSALGNPEGVAVDSAGNVYIADTGNNLVEKVTPSGTLSIIAGSYPPGTPTPGPAISSPAGVAVDSAGNVYIADTDSYIVVKITPSGALSVIAGTGSEGAPTPGPATSSDLWGPVGVAVDSAGNVYIADSHLAEEVTPSGTLSIIAGGGTTAPSTTPTPATSTQVTPEGVAVDPARNAYIADVYNCVVEEVGATGTGTSGVAPAFTADAPPSTTTVGVAYLYTFAATGVPAPGFTATRGSLPPGLSLDRTTGVLSGTPTTSGTFSFHVTAANGFTPNAVTPKLTITITPGTVNKGPAGPIVSGYHRTACVDDSNDSTANDTKIVMWDCNGTAQQDWTIAGDGTIRINGKCMDIYRDEKTNKAPVELWTCTGGANQQWQPRNGALVNPVSGQCLDDPRFNTADGTQLEIYTCNGGANQQWHLP